MPFMDKMKAGAAQAAQKAQQAAKAGQAKIDEAKAKREQDAMFRDLGAAVYAERTGTGDGSTAGEIDRLVAALKDHQATVAAAAEAAASQAPAEHGELPRPGGRFGGLQARRLSRHPVREEPGRRPGSSRTLVERSTLDDDDRSGREVRPSRSRRPMMP